ncbi:hypothetical protein [Zeaxanthinibacter enoshimensis]|uniref:Curlin associated repeat-containing protein n=1 Tax=Zeaxanthinibacter enoshimensis TaxID=392009 RepID=A0A4R6TFP8_9FLAO|nr:hypothetical protein [Zeaxanthinibacter enoshimensis]TDQ29155.1 hypothetical protein CLV82_2609 [Zeaxanthinibacter enoshimensis]
MKYIFKIIFCCVTLYPIYSYGQINGANHAATQAIYSSERLRSVLELPQQQEVNSVEIIQVGAGNESYTMINAQNSQVELIQNGMYNRINLDLTAGTINYNVLQNGDNNFLLEYARKNDNATIRRSVVQNGEKNNLIIHGRNSLSDQMSIQMNGGVTGLIIRNFN